jgi:hypothetical protein
MRTLEVVLVYELVSGEETLMMLGVEETSLLGQSTMATWNLVRIFMVKMAVFLMKRMLEVEETSLLGKSTMATWNLVRIFMVKMAVFLLKRMLEVEESSLLGQSTIATWNLVRIFMVKMAVFLLKKMLEVEETSQTATRTWGNTLGVGEMMTMATIETHSNEAYKEKVGKSVSLTGTVKTLGVEVPLMGELLMLATLNLVREQIKIFWMMRYTRTKEVVLVYEMIFWWRRTPYFQGRGC